MSGAAKRGARVENIVVLETIKDGKTVFRREP